MEAVATSKNGVPVRLTDERWADITEEHGELQGMREEVLDTVPRPGGVYAAMAGALLAVRQVQLGKWLVVVYRELRDDGFIITAFLTRRIASVEKRKRLWP